MPGREFMRDNSLSTELAAFNRLLKKTSHHPSPRRVHDLRVLSRKLRAHLWIIPRHQRNHTIKQAAKELRTLAQTLGEQRKFDVAIKDAVHYQRKTTSLEKQLKRAQKEVSHSLATTNRKHTQHVVAKAVREMERIPQSAYVVRLRKLSAQLDHARQHPPRTIRTKHELRIKVKRARYLLESLNHGLQELVVLQHHLGRWHDLIVLSSLSGQPANLVRAHREEWRIVERQLPTALAKASRSLSALANHLSERNPRPTVPRLQTRLKC